ncbi:ABC transporter permease [Paraprevotella clara]|jgi:ABC-2 type transport system permease protein|uniref:ABC transporter permease n=1 Tax=Paraprevotella clara TaxID=454154 RepID=UPI000E48445B|nr:ABC transporter permease [Paraprevotella clara]RGU61688.1 ABC transporter permease [Paraprevotella clara]
MKQFWAFIKIEFFHIFRDRRTMLILLGMPVLQIILFGFAITTELNHSRVAVLDPSKDAVTTRITERIDENRYFSVVKELSSASDIETVFRHDEADIVVAFTPDFDANLSTGEAGIQLVVDATDPNTGNMMAGYVQGIVGQALQSGTQSSPIVQTHLLFNPQMKSAYNFVPGVMGLILMLICAMMTSISIVREKETGTMEVLLVSPIRPIFIILAKAVPYLVLSCVNLITILLLSVYVLHVPVEGSLWTLSFLSLLLIAVALSLGLLISCVVQNQVAAMIVSGMGLMMPVMLLSGMIFPIESMPAVLQWISNIIPARWYIQAVKKVMIEGLGMAAVWHEALILSGMAALLIGLSLKKFKERLE